MELNAGSLQVLSDSSARWTKIKKNFAHLHQGANALSNEMPDLGWEVSELTDSSEFTITAAGRTARIGLISAIDGPNLLHGKVICVAEGPSSLHIQPSWVASFQLLRDGRTDCQIDGRYAYATDKTYAGWLCAQLVLSVLEHDPVLESAP